ncbi:MAG: DUF3800 domain-containing protein [bacterium]
MKYRIYIDEIGNPDLESSDNPNHRFLSLTGVILDLEYVQSTLHPQMEALKREYFRSHPDEPIILHRKELMNAKPPFERLSDPEVRSRFDEELIALLKSWHYTVITVCLDKKRHKETYQTWRYDPYHYCLIVLLERFVLFLTRKQRKGDAMAESRGGKEDRRLKDSFLRLWQRGTEYIAAESFQQVLTSKQLKVKTKANNIAGLQLTDILAHPSRSEILDEQGMLGRSLGTYAKRIIDISQSKYDHVDGRVYGKKFL